MFATEILFTQSPKFSENNFEFEPSTHNGSNGERLFCLGLTIVKDEPTWEYTEIYAMCKGTESNASSRWYNLDKSIKVNEQGFEPAQNPRREFPVVLNNNLTTSPTSTALSPATTSSPARAAEKSSMVSSTHFGLLFFVQ